MLGADLAETGSDLNLVVGEIRRVSESIGFSKQTGPQTTQTSPPDPPDPPGPPQKVLEIICIFLNFFGGRALAKQLTRRPPLPLRGSGGRRAMLKRRLNRYTKRPLREGIT